MNNTLYTLIIWPWSQQFIGMDNCLFYNGETDGEFDSSLSQAIFVPNETLAQMDPKEFRKITDGMEKEYSGVPETMNDAEGRTGLYYNEEEEGLVFLPVEE